MPNANNLFSSNTAQGPGMLRLNFKDVMDAVDNTRKTYVHTIIVESASSYGDVWILI